MKKTEVFPKMECLAPPLCFPRSPRLAEITLDSLMWTLGMARRQTGEIIQPSGKEKKKIPFYQKQKIQEKKNHKDILNIYI